jgi:hypothetical protein
MDLNQRIVWGQPIISINCITCCTNSQQIKRFELCTSHSPIIIVLISFWDHMRSGCPRLHIHCIDTHSICTQFPQVKPFSFPKRNNPSFSDDFSITMSQMLCQFRNICIDHLLHHTKWPCRHLDLHVLIWQSLFFWYFLRPSFQGCFCDCIS